MASCSVQNADLVREYLTWFRDARRAKGGSVYNYASVLDKYLAHLDGTPIGSASVAQMDAFVQRARTGRAKGRPAADATVAKEVAILRALYKHLHARGSIERNPSLLLIGPTVRNEQPRSIADDVWLHVWGSKRLPAEGRVVLGLGYFLGLRRSEIVALAPRHLSRPSRMLIGFTRKGGGDDTLPYGSMVGIIGRELPHLFGGGGPDSFLDALHGHLESRLGHDLLLSWGEETPASAISRRKHALPDGAIDPQRLNKRLHRWLRAVGLPATAFTPHCLRHSCATNLLRAAVPPHLVQRLMNHTSFSTTQRYVRAGSDELAEWMRRGEPSPDSVGGFNRW